MQKINLNIFTRSALEKWLDVWEQAEEIAQIAVRDMHEDNYGDDWERDYDSYTDEELAAEYGAELPYPDYELDEIELPGFGATAKDVEVILDDMPSLDEPDEDAEIW